MKRVMFPFEGREETQRKVWLLSRGNQLALETVFTRHNMVRLMAQQTTKIEGITQEVIRYDSCHGTLHRHLLFEGIDKQEELGWPLSKETIHRIIADLKQYWIERLGKYLK